MDDLYWLIELVATPQREAEIPNEDEKNRCARDTATTTRSTASAARGRPRSARNAPSARRSMTSAASPSRADDDRRCDRGARASGQAPVARRQDIATDVTPQRRRVGLSFSGAVPAPASRAGGLNRPASNRDRCHRRRAAELGSADHWDQARTNQCRLPRRRDGIRAVPAPARNPPG